MPVVEGVAACRRAETASGECQLNSINALVEGMAAC